MGENQIVISNFQQFYGKRQVLYDVNFTMKTGMVGLLGKNGAGKTTLLKSMATLLPVRHGSIHICGHSVKEVREVRKIIGYLPQDFSMYPSMTVREAMNYLGVLSDMTAAQRRRRIPFLLEQVNLEREQNKRIKMLSGGMKRRLGIAQALLHDPRVLIVDEPTAGLDPEERVRFRNLLGEVAKERIVVLSTHIVGDVEAACPNIGVLDGGHMIFTGTVKELIQNAQGFVYERRLPAKELEEFQREYAVAGIRTEEEYVTVRYITEREQPGAEWVKPNMEEAYMYCVQAGGKGTGAKALE